MSRYKIEATFRPTPRIEVVFTVEASTEDPETVGYQAARMMDVFERTLFPPRKVSDTKDDS